MNSLKLEIVFITLVGKSQKQIYNRLADVLEIDKEDNPFIYPNVTYFIADPDKPKEKALVIGVSIIFLDYNFYLARVKLLVRNKYISWTYKLWTIKS